MATNQNTKQNEEFKGFKIKKGSKHILILLENRKVFLSFLLLVVFPIIVLQTTIEYYNYEITGISINWYFLQWLIIAPFSILIYSIVMLFTMSYTTLRKIKGENKISFLCIIKLIPEIAKKTLFSVVFVALIFTVLKTIMFIVPFVFLIIFPISAIATLYNKDILNSDIIKISKEYRKTKGGQKHIGTLILVGIITFIAFSILFFVFTGLTSSFNIGYYINSIIIQSVNELFTSTGLFIIFVYINTIYSEKVFNIPSNIHKKAIEILSGTKREEKNRRKNFKKKNNKLSFKNDKVKEKNRFEEDHSFNRFEDTKF